MRWWVVNVVQMLFCFLWSAFWISAAFVMTLLTFNRSIALVMARRIWAPTLIKASGAKFKVEPLPDVDWSQPHIFVMNHQSMIDIPCAFAGLPSNIRFVAKEQLRWIPFLGWYIWMTGMVFVDRRRRSRAVASLEQAGQRIRQGATILAYPEGTRSPDGRVMPFKKGPFVLALSAQVPIVPIAIEGSGKVSGKQGVWKLRPAEVRMKVGQPISTAGLTDDDRDQLLHDVRAAIVKLHREIGGLGGVDADIAAAGVEGLSEPEPKPDGTPA
ncbi:MAG: 1-acyl-sn-glycerol-3-phosphate acyltransferase [Archangiaceae bacterium]|nr:1-acyl-sn-glycerol-3-phosphate acyltransferase [Archangiaceae bacterium]